MHKKTTHLLLASLLMLSLSGCTPPPLSSRDGVLNKLDDTTNPDLHEAIVAYQQGRLADAETFYLKFLDQHQQFPEAWFKLGNVYFRTGRYEAAITAYEKSISYDRQNDKAWHNLALARIKQAEHTLLEGERLFAQDDQRRNRLKQLRTRIQLRTATDQGSHIPKRYRKPLASNANQR